MLNLIEQIMEYEGFREYPYIDPIVDVSDEFRKQYNKLLPKLNLTIGYGTLLPITKQEAEYLLVHRLNAIINEMKKECLVYDKLPKQAKEVLNNMAYNLGVPKLCGFKKMWRALEDDNYQAAAAEMLDSKWANDVGDRAIRLAEQMRNIKG